MADDPKKPPTPDGNVAVKLVKNAASNPTGLPAGWITDIMNLGPNEQPPDATWTVMTRVEYARYIQAQSHDFVIWQKSSIAKQAARDLIIKDIEGRIKYGKQGILLFRVATMPIPDDQGMQLLQELSFVKELVEIGMLKAASLVLSEFTDIPYLQNPYDIDIPNGPTILQYFVDYLAAGDPT